MLCFLPEGSKTSKYKMMLVQASVPQFSKIPHPVSFLPAQKAFSAQFVCSLLYDTFGQFFISSKSPRISCSITAA